MGDRGEGGVGDSESEKSWKRESERVRAGSLGLSEWTVEYGVDE
jgi:hypothetical protein